MQRAYILKEGSGINCKVCSGAKDAARTAATIITTSILIGISHLQSTCSEKATNAHVVRYLILARLIFPSIFLASIIEGSSLNFLVSHLDV
jgi:hypothetical protein